tara:strand:+ start:102 stop:935 length:834 start_codon:yes stop_codon:yes gene_type:complete
MKIIFIADFFLEDILGGGEIHNEILISLLEKKGYDVVKYKSHNVSPNILEQNKNSYFIVANFINLSEKCKKILKDKKYIIYEHDHKYIISRNPAGYEDFKAPEKDLINLDFYENAKNVFCQTDFHADIVKKNLNFHNIVSVGGNLWSNQTLNLMEKLSKTDKKDKYSIINSNIPHKGTQRSIKFCEYKDLNYDLISSRKYHDFLFLLSKNKNLVFLPSTPETLSRVAVEARMMNVSVITNNLVGATKESWYNLKGVELINKMRNKHKEIVHAIEGAF